MTLSTALDTITAAIRELEQREAAVAAAAEQLSQDAAVKAAMAQGQTMERQRVLQLVDAMRVGFLPGRFQVILDALKRQIIDLTPIQ